MVSLELPIAKSNSDGISSWWKLVIATYSPGKSIAKNNEILLISLKKLAKLKFKLLSSGDFKKSIKIAGKIKAYGDPFTNTAIFPSKSEFETLSGLSVASIWGKGEYLLSWINCSNCPWRSDIVYI